MLLAVGLGYLDYAAVVAYLAAVLAVGFACRKSGDDTESYLLGGRRMPWWLVGVSYTVTFLSAISLVGSPGEAYKNGLTAALSPLLGLILSIAFFFLFIRFYFQGPTFTPFEYLERRFGQTTRLMAATIYCTARGVYLGTVLFATAKVFEGLVGWPYHYSILLAGGICLVYTTVGGMRAVVWTDLMQCIVLLSALGMIVYIAVDKTPGGFLEPLRHAARNDHLLPDLKNPSFYSPSIFARMTLWMLLFRAIGDHLFYKSADQILIQRMLATSNYRSAFRCTVLGSALAAFMVVVLYYVGLCMYQFYMQPGRDRGPAADLALFAFISEELPSPFSGMVVAAVLAAVMSTLDSGANSLSTVLTKDFYQRFWRPEATEAEQIRVSKRATVACGIMIIALALGIASLSEKARATVLESASVWMSLILVLGPVFLMGVLSRRGTERHALISMASGALATVVMIALYYAMKFQGQEIGFHAVAVVVFLTSLVTAVGASRFSRRLPDRQLYNLTLWTVSYGAKEPPPGEL